MNYSPEKIGVTQKNKGGRPSIYTKELAEEICARLIEGEALYKICLEDHLPDTATVDRWAEEDRDGFAAMYARARRAQAEFMDAKIAEIAESAKSNPQAAAVELKAAIWRAERLNRGRYHSSVDVTSGGEKLQITIAKDDFDLG